MTRDIIIDALRMAWFKQHPSQQAGLMLHSDCGNYYGRKEFRDVLKQCGIAISSTTTATAITTITTPTATTLQRAPPR